MYTAAPATTVLAIPTGLVKNDAILSLDAPAAVSANPFKNALTAV